MTTRLKITASRWPWQPGYNWNGMTNSTAPLNQPKPGENAAPRFGAGWKYRLGVSTGGMSEYGWTLHIDLLFGMVDIRYRSARGIEADKARAERYANIRATTGVSS